MRVQTNPDTVVIHDHELREILAQAINERTGRDMANIDMAEVLPVYPLGGRRHERVDLTISLHPRSEA